MMSLNNTNCYNTQNDSTRLGLILGVSKRPESACLFGKSVVPVSKNQSLTGPYRQRL